MIQQESRLRVADNSARLGHVRREIARIATILREREIEAAEAAAREVNA